MQQIDKQLAPLAQEIKAYMISVINAQRQGNLINDKKGFVGQSEVQVTTQGAEISIPPQGLYMEYGRRPGGLRVPISALIGWLRRYHIVGRNRKSGRFERTSEASLNSAAWAIQQAIFRFGIQPKPFIEDTLEYAEAVLSKAIDEILLPQIVNILEIEFK